MKHNPDQNTDKIRKWLKKSKRNITRLADFVENEGHSPHGIAHVLGGHEFKEFRKQIIKEFKIK